MPKIVLSFIAFILLFSCSRYPSDVEQALKLAGDNRAELEKVLDYYRQETKDSLKYKAAFFLIANMPGHYELRSDQIDTIRAGLRRGILPSESKLYMESTVYPIYDIHKISSDYLINNIDFSFKIWEEAPWGHNVSFSDFCEHILPYRLNNEPLERWKEEYYNYFHSIIEITILDNDLAEFCQQLIAQLNKEQWFFDNNFSCPGLGALALLRTRYGNCRDQADFVTYALRSLGIPSGIDMILQNADSNYQDHYWNYIRISENHHICVESFKLFNGTSLLDTVRKYGKIYRLCYAVQKESLAERYKDRYITPLLSSSFLKDISRQYFPNIGVSFPIDLQKTKSEILYLCVSNGQTWIPVAGAKPFNDSIAFRNIEPDILYQISYIYKNKHIEIIPPFVYKTDGTNLFIKADTSQLQTMKIRRKYPFHNRWLFYFYRFSGGKFQGADDPDFSDAVTLHLISDSIDGLWKNITVDHSESFKYVRYLSAEGGHNSMAEMDFFLGGKKLTGSIIGTDANYYHPTWTKEKAMDGDQLTFYFGEPSGSWVGLEFEKPQKIDQIKYLFRNDDNYIRPGDIYEFFYYKEGTWISKGEITADTTYLLYEKIPSGTLYFLKNHTRGKEERLFTYENNKQVFW